MKTSPTSKTFVTTDPAPDRPRSHVVDQLPRNALFYGRQSAWDNIGVMLWNNTGKWVQLQRAYTNPSSAVHQARRVIRERYGDEVAATLRTAYIPFRDGKANIVYLMLDYYEEQPVPAVDPENLNLDFDNESPGYDGEPLDDDEDERRPF